MVDVGGIEQNILQSITRAINSKILKYLPQMKQENSMPTGQDKVGGVKSSTVKNCYTKTIVEYHGLIRTIDPKGGLVQILDQNFLN